MQHTEVITLRPHHVLCNYCFQGKGYSPDFVKNFSRIHTALQENPQQKIRVTSQVDEVCQPCPHRQGAACQSQAKVMHLDALHLQALALQEGQLLTWQEAVARIHTAINETTFEAICSTCSWYALNICRHHLFKN